MFPKLNVYFPFAFTADSRTAAESFVHFSQPQSQPQPNPGSSPDLGLGGVCVLPTPVFQGGGPTIWGGGGYALCWWTKRGPFQTNNNTGTPIYSQHFEGCAWGMILLFVPPSPLPLTHTPHGCPSVATGEPFYVDHPQGPDSTASDSFPPL